MNVIPYEQFASVELRVGTITRAENFERAKKPAYKIWADFGTEIGIKQSSAQVTAHYSAEQLVGRQIVGCVNLGAKNIAGFQSEFLCTGFADADGNIVLIAPDKKVPNGAKLF